MVALAAVTVLAGGAVSATVEELLTKSQSQPLTSEECGHLSQALADKGYAAKWLDIAGALKANWDRTAVGAWEQVSLVKDACDGFNAAQKSGMIAALHELYAADGPVLKTLDSGEATELALILFGLGEQAPASDLLAGWMAVNDGWQTQANHDQLPDLMEVLKAGTSQAVVQQKAALTGQVWSKYLSAEAPGRVQATFGQLVYTLWMFHTELSQEQVAELGPRLLGWLKDAQVVSSAKVGTVRVAETLPPGFGLAAQYPEIAATWVAASEQWRDLAEEDLVTLALAIGSGTSELCQQQATKLPPLFVEKYFGDDPAPLPFAKGVYFSRRMFRLLSLAQRRQVVDKLAPAAGQAQDILVLTELAALLQEAERIGKDKGYTEYAGALAQALRAGAVVKHAGLVALPLGTAPTRAALASALTDAEGGVRRQVARVLGYAYREYESMDAWRQLIDQRLTDASITGDRKAGWLLVRGDAEVIATDRRGKVSPLAGKGWIDQAMAAASGEGMKLACVEALALGYAQLLLEGKARSLLAGVRGQFEDPESLARLDAIGEQVGQVAADVAARSKAEKLAARRQGRVAHIAELRRRLEIAQSKGDQQAIQWYQRLLANLE